MASRVDRKQNLIRSFSALRWYERVMAGIMIAIAAYYMILSFVRPEASGNPAWLAVLNFVSGVAGVFCIFFCAKASVSNYIFGLVNTAVYIVYLAYWRIYGTMCLELFLYLPMGIAGWIHWARHRDEKHPENTRARSLNALQTAAAALLVCAVTAVCHAFLAKAGGIVVWLDAATVAIGIVATVLQTLRFREQYVWWLITDVVAVVMYIVHFDPVYLTKKTIYLIMAFIGLYNWVRMSRENSGNE